MKFLFPFTRVSLLLVGSLAAACSAPASNDDTSDSTSSDLIAGRVGAVYTLSNDSASNAVIVFRRAADGSLQPAASYATTGKGSGDGLGSQGLIVLSQNRGWLFAVNAGSNELSVFRAHGESLYLVDTVATGGVRPISVTEHDGVVYVLHAGDGQNGITGFYQRYDGTLAAIAGSTQSLSAPSVGPAEIAFSANGRTLIVTEKMTNKLDEFSVDPYTGVAGSLVVRDSNGQTPFGFAVTQREQLVVSEAFGGSAGASTVSSYRLGHAATDFSTVSASVPDTQGAACWVALAKNDTFAYVANTGSGSISEYTVGNDGAVALVGTGSAASTGEGSKPTDLAVSRNDRFLYVVNSGNATIGIQQIEDDGSLTSLPDVTGLPATVTGIAAQ